jgi:hypothetical protein
MTFNRLLCSILLFAATRSAFGEVNLMPWPAKIESYDGYIALDKPPAFRIAGGDKRVAFAVLHFKEQLSLRTGVNFRSGDADGPAIEIRCGSAGQRVQKLGEDESYSLQVDTNGIHLIAGNPVAVGASW